MPTSSMKSFSSVSTNSSIHRSVPTESQCSSQAVMDRTPASGGRPTCNVRTEVRSEPLHSPRSRAQQALRDADENCCIAQKPGTSIARRRRREGRAMCGIRSGCDETMVSKLLNRPQILICSLHTRVSKSTRGLMVSSTVAHPHIGKTGDGE